jgi:hypothetical protein
MSPLATGDGVLFASGVGEAWFLKTEICNDCVISNFTATIDDLNKYDRLIIIKDVLNLDKIM